VIVTPPAVVADALHALCSDDAVPPAPYHDHCHWYEAGPL
jgi:hypothetical protein